MESNKELVVGIDKRIPFKERFLFPMTGGSACFFLTMISTWLLFFYSDILKINVAYVGVMFVVVRIFDAVLSPLFGVFLDRQNTRWGKYKPWLFIVWAGMAVGGFLTFLPVHFGQVGNTIWATITYFFFSIFCSMNQAPGTGMTAAMTKRQDDRMNFSALAFVWVMVFTIIVMIGSQPMLNALGHGNMAIGFKKLMFIAMIACIVLIIIILTNIKERFIIETDKESKVDAKLIIRTVVQNKYLIITLVYILGLNLFNYVRQTIQIYYFKYYFNDAGMMMTLGAITMVPTFIGVFLSSPITKKIGLKMNIFIMVIVTIVTNVMMFFLPATASGKTVFFVLSAIGGLFMGIAQPAQGVMTPMSVDYGEWKFNTSTGGFFGAINGFIQTFSTAIAGGVAALVLAVVHYVPDQAQTATALAGIKFGMTLLPAIAFLLGLAILKWDITEEKHKEIIHELNQRKNSSEEENNTK